MPSEPQIESGVDHDPCRAIQALERIATAKLRFYKEKRPMRESLRYVVYDAMAKPVEVARFKYEHHAAAMLDLMRKEYSNQEGK